MQTLHRIVYEMERTLDEVDPSLFRGLDEGLIDVLLYIFVLKK